MMFRRFCRRTLVLLALLIVGCDKADSPSVSIPQAQLSCEIPECSSSVTATSALVLLSRSGCTNDFDIAASSTASWSCTSEGCFGATNGWVDDSGENLETLPSGTYDFCVLVDEDQSGSQVYTPGDLVFEDTVSLGGGILSAEGSLWTVVD